MRNVYLNKLHLNMQIGNISIEETGIRMYRAGGKEQVRICRYPRTQLEAVLPCCSVRP